MELLYGINNSNLPDSISWNVTYLTQLQPDSVKRNSPDAGPLTRRSKSETRVKDLNSPQEGLYTLWVLIVSHALTISTLDGSPVTLNNPLDDLHLTSTAHGQRYVSFLLFISFFWLQDISHIHQNIDGSWLQPWMVMTWYYERQLSLDHNEGKSVYNILYRLDG